MSMPSLRHLLMLLLLSVLVSCGDDSSDDEDEISVPPPSPTGPQYQSSFGTQGTAAGEFNRPNGITVDDDGNLYVVDTYNSRIQKIDPALFSASVFASGQRTGIAFDPVSLHLFSTVSPGGHVVSEFSTSGTLVRSLSSAYPDDMRWPHSAATDRFGRVFVTDTGFNRIRRFTNGMLDLSFSRGGSNVDEVFNPSGIAVTNDDRVYVADWSNHRIQVFTTDGVHLGSFGREGRNPGEFFEPCGVEAAGGYLYVADWGNNRIQRFTLDGGFVDQFGSEGTGNGQFRGPADVCVDFPRGVIYVTDTFNHRIQRWTYAAPASTGPPTLTRPAPYVPPPTTSDPPPVQDVIAYNLRTFYDSNRHFHPATGHWDRGYFDFFPPFHVWSDLPLHRQQNERIVSFFLMLQSGEIPERETILMLSQIRSSLNYVVTKQQPDGSFLWYNNDESASGAHVFETGLAAEALAMGYQSFSEVAYLIAAVRASDWLRLQGMSGNLNYNSLTILGLCRTYNITGNTAYLDDAVSRQRFINGFQNADGSFGDSHNRKTTYHYVLMRGLLELCRSLTPTDPRFAEFQTVADRGLAFLLSLQTASGGFLTAAPGAERDAIDVFGIGGDILAMGILILNRTDLIPAHNRALRYALYVNQGPLYYQGHGIMAERALLVLP